MAWAVIGGMVTVAMICLTVVVLSAIRTPDYDESTADDREFD